MDDIEAWKEVHQHLMIAITLTKDSIHEEKAKRRLLLEELYNHLKPDGTSKWIQNSNKIKRKTKTNNEKGGTIRKRKLSSSSSARSGGGGKGDDGTSTKQQSKSIAKTTKKASSSDKSDSVKKRKKNTNSPKKKQDNEKVPTSLKPNISIAGLGETNIVDHERKSFTVSMSPILTANRSITQGNNMSSNINDKITDQEVVTSYSISPESTLYNQHNIANNEHNMIKTSTSTSSATPVVTSSPPFQQLYPTTSPQVQNNTQSSAEMNYFHNPISYSILDARAIDAAAAVASALTAQSITSSLSNTAKNNHSGSTIEYFGNDTFDSTRASESLMPPNSGSQNASYKKDDDKIDNNS